MPPARSVISTENCGSKLNRRVRVNSYILAGLFLAGLLAMCPVAAAMPFAAWKERFNKTYASSAEEQARRRVYLGNLRWLENANAANASSPYTLGVSAFTDRRFSEGE